MNWPLESCQSNTRKYFKCNSITQLSWRKLVSYTAVIFSFPSLLSLEALPSCLLSVGAGFSCHTAYSWESLAFFPALCSSRMLPCCFLIPVMTASKAEVVSFVSLLLLSHVMIFGKSVDLQHCKITPTMKNESKNAKQVNESLQGQVQV